MADEQTQNIIQPEIEEETTVDLPYRVILYNDDIHTFDEVIRQLIKALKCSFEQAKSYAFEAHVKGKAKIFEGELSECLRVTSVLEEIELHTQIIA
ncbi:ATP-dependent Clp protease adaptor protein ClpS [Melioribacter roseus P3M-2]|uniref:ATP-dependent Clp protease adaptor protein ClpS n=2 Tax=Melioribacteraceae TaxID=1334117 RepID=I6ZU98_MELRP|nr:ATP-dependent Clp protease adaptor protein ClpS [Melioribacter roseus P3M-2]